MKSAKNYTRRRTMRAAQEERENDRALFLTVLRVLLHSMTPEQYSDLAPRVRAICEEFAE